MNPFLIIAIAVALGFDTFSVGIAAGAAGARNDVGALSRLALSFGFFQFAMCVAGYLLGANLGAALSNYDHCAAFLLLAFIGIKMICDSFKEEEKRTSADITKGATLLAFSLATSIDALAVGVSFGLIGNSALAASVEIGVVASIMTCLGVLLGDKIGALLGKRATMVGGCVLIIIGIKVLAEHLL